ncbi:MULTISPECIES: bifunctional diaminohydroxyphosphoribosylaminopyrimidine deaminase/5-amino-6-(5-phosphoribosylamino)uracil reductase RibD [unclassified Clostridium]|uniref:bifunctional diaminohydroxyphosphoribosylaminopyrimidine deaminase/5-amino-6-(5-phosphoribosylamino)uracil reductase RibD n=1 Tax=unclassified Clostridium TaxID=2614128 RepID=UPI002A74B488|nr:bifunctional diaminohydroxyphosphoribosylaminopyrimidine deaminase/5-amino-6-(5-phosphoribosylamino)uracil reductase RibD [Clostridium sp.]MCI6691987.1 bifunctional diaminohydroxyphosphoribosylaminopyrimidine deaminase/5-amino-6-(5-phosphoribosylamino)uracil reductase RibD [Clostridium sp.]MDY2632222.1 bifunctional diaminohydroxyphosphoribosylaminopyrimidine deaminase/5-amino-6-(5-phosphoribosylamino)uracil reductase RibD [Clostridium sp.]
MEEKFMKMAIELAKKGKGKVNPNPLVGAVIVKNGEIIGQGYHSKYGGNHAEIEAINNATDDVKGATIYVTLEPCFHYGKTPPCVDKLISSGISKVVIGHLDPNPLVSGKSIEKLKSLGIEVKVGVLEEECLKLNEVFIKYIKTKLPFVVLKSGVSLDGKIATKTGESKWITGATSRAKVNELRNELRGIMVGVNTVIIDDPTLNCNIHGGRNPIRIILDSNLRIPLDSKILKTAYKYETIIATTKNIDLNKKALVEELKAKVITIDSINNKVDLNKLMIKLGEMKIDSILLEGGGEVNYSALEAGIIDKLMLFMAPVIIGGKESKTFVEGKGIDLLTNSFKASNLKIEYLGEDILITSYIRR